MGRNPIRPPDGTDDEGLPFVGAIAETVWRRLPEFYRTADASNGYALRLYLSSILSQLDEVTTVMANIEYVPYADRGGVGKYDVAQPWTTIDDEDTRSTSDLIDAATAPEEWLAWLCQLLGVSPSYVGENEIRTALGDPDAYAWNHGTRAAIVRQAQRTLGASAAVTLEPNKLDSIHGTSRAQPFVIGVKVATADTSVLVTWGQLNAAAPTWDQLEAIGTFGSAGIGAVYAAIEPERPAGFEFQVTLI